MSKMQRKPFHEALVFAIGVMDANTITLVQKLIKMTIIPKGHDAIIVALEERIEEASNLPTSNLYFFESDLESMKEEVSKQKVEAEAREAEKQKNQAEEQAEQSAAENQLATKLRMLMELNGIIVDSRLTPGLILQFGSISEAIAKAGAKTSEDLERIQRQIDLLKTA